MSRFYAALIALTAVALNGCATTIMKDYMGQPLQVAMMDYGPPVNAFDMPDGTRAFQWVIRKSYTPPLTAHQTGDAYAYGNRVNWYQQTQITGGQPIQSECAYTMIAKWDDTQNAWVFTSFRKPRWACE